MRREAVWLAVLVGLPVAGWRACGAWDVRRFGGTGIVAPDAPLQEETDAAPFSHSGFLVTPTASFSATTRVLHARDYRHEVDGELVPVDLAVAWGPLSEAGPAQALWVHQGERYYSWRTDADFPLDTRTVAHSSANMHMIPADDAIADVLLSVDRGDVITFSGWLVDVDGAQRTWHSSLSREDSGSYACEVVYVSALQIDS